MLGVEHEGVVREVVRDHGRGVQRVVVQHAHGVVQVHARLRLQNDRSLVSILRVQAFRDASRHQKALVAAHLCHQRKDLDALSPHEDVREGNDADVGHAHVVRDDLELAREPVAELAVLHAVLGDPRTVLG